jgi:phosphoglycerate dehydrogenase-like enzyme
MSDGPRHLDGDYDPRMPRVIVDPYPRQMDEIFSPQDRARLDGLADVVWGRDDQMPEDLARSAIERADIVVTGAWRYGQLLDEAPSLRAIIDVSGGFPATLDYAVCFQRGVRVLSVAPAFAPQVAEMALALALAAGREIADGDRAMRDGTERWLHAGSGSTSLLSGRSIGFVGFGNIGHNLVELLAPFSCDVAAYDPWYGNGQLEHEGVRPTSLGSLMSDADVIFVLARPTPDNRAMLDRALLSRIRPGSILVLVSRAHLVYFDALTELVLAGRFKAAIDVFPDEPLRKDHPIRTAPLATLSAHRAGTVPEGLHLIGEMVVDDIEAILRGLPARRLQGASPELIGSQITPGAKR